VASCTHLDQAVDDKERSTPDGCTTCLAAGSHDWVHLRKCLECGLVGCCDSSPQRHASAHARDEKHPVVRSMEPGETWRWCYEDEILG